MKNEIIIYLLTSSFLLTSCQLPNTVNISSENQTSNSVSSIAPPPQEEEDNAILEPITFDVRGDRINDWYWIRNPQLTQYAAWTIKDVPVDKASIEISFNVLATNRSSGDRGYDADFRLTYGPPGGPYFAKQVNLPNVSPKSDPVGYTCIGKVSLPVSALGSGNTLYLKAERTSKSAHHVAFKKDSIANYWASDTISETGSLLADLETSGNEEEATSENTGTTDDETNLQPETDTDGDGLLDSDETLFGMNINSTDSDGDGVSDGEDLSPLINPAEPTLLNLQKPGMIRVTQPFMAIGLDGWVETYTKVYRVWPLPNYYVHNNTYESEGTKKSTMDSVTYKKALNRIFESTGFDAYDIDNITPEELGVAEVEMTHDHVKEHDYTYLASFLHPNEYRFYHDWITDFRIAHLRNADFVKYPDTQTYFKYILPAVKVARNLDQTINIQFKDATVYQALNYQNDDNYKVPALLYSFYKSDDFLNNANLPFYGGAAIALIERENQFQVSISLPKEKATRDQVYLKITPVWAENVNGHLNYVPLSPSWDITGLSQSFVYQQLSDGSSKVMTREVNDFEGLNQAVPAISYFSDKTNSGDYHTRTKDFNSITFDPAKTSDRFRLTESENKVQTYASKTLSAVNGFVSLTENLVKADWDVDSLANLPADHWARSTKYGGIAGTLSVTSGVISMMSDGNSAWTAYKNGNTVDVAYYSARTAITGAQTVVSLAEVSTRTFGYAGKASKFAKLTSNKVGVGLAVAVGTVEVIYNGYQLANTDDPILKLAYQENIAASVANTGLSIAAVFVPHALVFQITWSIEAEIYSMIWGEDFAYQIAQSPGSALTFLTTYFVTGGIDSHMADAAYLDAREELMTQMDFWNDTPLPYIAVFIDPDL